MRFHKRQPETEKRPFTALIDVVFLLLVFFMLTLKIVEPEGQLTVEAGPTIASPPTFPTNLPINVWLESSSNGSLTDVRLAGRSLGADEAGIERLRTEMRKLFPINKSKMWDAEQTVILRADVDLQYQHIVAALSACSGDVRSMGSRSRVVKYPVKVAFDSAN